MSALRPCAIVCGADEVASAVALRLVEAGYTVLLAAEPGPAVTRRGLSFADAALDGEARLDGVRCRRIGDAAEWLRDGAHDVAYCSQPLATLLSILEPEVLAGACGKAYATSIDLGVEPGRKDATAESSARIAAGVLQAIIRRDGLPPLARAAVAGVLRNALAGELALFAATLGFDRREYRALVAACLPGTEPEREWETGAYAVCASQAPALFAPLAELLLAHRALDLAERPARWLAHALAAAGFGARHLWQDLGLAGRAEVSRLLYLCFPALAAQNTTDLKWKRFLFQALGNKLGQPGLMPPNCGSCDSYPDCFGSPLPERQRQAPLDDTKA
jgi:nitrogen fixation protein NifQ